MGGFFFKQKAAYDVEYGLVGPEMCIRDSNTPMQHALAAYMADPAPHLGLADFYQRKRDLFRACLLYTSDAADERSSVDLGGRRIIQKTHSTRPYVVSISLTPIND